MARAIVARRALSPSTPRAEGAPLRASGVDRSARPSKWLSCQQCEEAPLGLPRSIFNRHPPEVSITEICYQFRVSHMGCSPFPLRMCPGRTINSLSGKADCPQKPMCLQINCWVRGRRAPAVCRHRHQAALPRRAPRLLT